MSELQPSIVRFKIPSEVFGHEILKIVSNDARKTVLRMLIAAPEEFWYGPSSYSGKYHSPDEYGMGGNALHTRRVFRVLMALIDAGYEEFDDDSKDMMLCAALVHDTLQGSTGSSDHMSLFYNYYEKHLDKDTKSLGWWEGICIIAQSHMGRWSPVTDQYPNTSEQWLLHYADMIATKFDGLQILKEKDYEFDPHLYYPYIIHPSTELTMKTPDEVAESYSKKPASIAFPDAVEAIKNEKCPTCGGDIGEFKDEISKREYEISGLCQKCQDIAFKGEDY